MSSKRHRLKGTAETSLGFQIAPMIDVVFVILLFFIVQAGDIQVEKSHVTKLPKLPSTEISVEPTPLLDEVFVRIEDDGQVYLNDDPLDTPEVKNLPEFASTMSQLRESSMASQAKMLVTICPNELARYDRVVDVLDALSRAKVSDVSFQAGSLE